MNSGKERFRYFLSRLEAGMKTAASRKNPALWLYQNNTRTPLFMLEGLCRLYADIHHRKKFTRLKERFKLLEDGIGSIDFYDAAAKQLAVKKGIPATVVQYLQAQTREKIQHLNDVLAAEEWTGGGMIRLQKINKKLEEARWLDEETETLEIEIAYRNTIHALIRFARETGAFNNMEEDVHELRRKLRWLSIYAHALQGTAQLVTLRKPTASLAPYLTPAVLASPFNQLPEPGPHSSFLLLNRNYFLALSWIIDQLGKLKDEGLLVLAVKEALQQSENLEDDAAIRKASKLLGKPAGYLDQLLRRASEASQRFFKENHLSHLVIGTVHPLPGSK